MKNKKPTFNPPISLSYLSDNEIQTSDFNFVNNDNQLVNTSEDIVINLEQLIPLSYKKLVIHLLDTVE